MESKKTGKDEKLEKELRTLVSQMKDENAALNKILVQLKFREDEMLRKKGDSGEHIKK
jgi:putative IMPACT (imprinted ancient) family translation regulator